MITQNNAPTTTTLRLVGIVRVSTLGQASSDMTGIPRQHESIEKTRLRINGEWVRPPFELRDVSGSDVLETSEFSDLIGMMKAGKLDGVVVEEFTRLCRPGTYHDFIILQYFKDCDVKLYTRDGLMDLNKPSENLMAGITATIAGYEKILIKGRLNGGKERKRRSGELPDAFATLPCFVSYDRKSKIWSYTEELARVLQCAEIIEMGGTLREAERTVGIRHETLSNLLRNKLLIGIREYRHKRGDQKYRSRDGRQADHKRVLRRPEEIISVQVIQEPAISLDRFNRLQKILEDRHTAWTDRRTQYSDDWLNGILECLCGQKINLFRGAWGKNHPPRKDRYFCRSQLHSFNNTYVRCSNPRVLRSEVERDVIAFVQAHFCSHETLSTLVSACIKSEQGVAGLETEIAQVKRLISEAQKEKDRLLGLFSKGLFSEEDLTKKVTALNTRLQHDSLLLADLERKKAMLATTFSSQTIANIVSLFAEFEFLSPTDKHRVLSMCLPKLRYAGGKGIIGATLAGSVSDLGTLSTMARSPRCTPTARATPLPA